MSQPTQAAPADASRYLPLLLVLFAGSGCSALIYETVWYQLLQLAIGSTAVSLGFLLATFMGGLCIGSVWFPRLRLAGPHPLRIYAYLELGIAASALLVHLLLPLVNLAYIAGAEHGMPGFLLRGFLSAICLLPPTILMGASLPAIVRWLKSTPNGVSWYGLLYGGNTAGAVFGCLLAGFYLLRLYNMSVATYAAAAINVAVALASFALAAHTPAEASVPATAPNSAEASAEAAAVAAPAPAPDAPGDGIPRWAIYVAIGLSDATALGAEVVWTRLLGMLLGLTVYVFSIILAVFLARHPALDHLRRHRALRRHRPRRRSGVDPAPRHAPRPDGLRLLHHSGGLPDRPRSRQRARRHAAALRAPAPRPRLVAGAAHARHRVDRVDRLHVAPLLAHQPAAHAQPLAHLPARYGALPVGHPAAHHPLGRELSAGRRRPLAPWRGPWADRRQRLCRQYPGRDFRSAHRLSRPHPLDRHAGFAARPHLGRPRRRRADPGPLRPCAAFHRSVRRPRRRRGPRRLAVQQPRARSRRTHRLWTPHGAERGQERSAVHHRRPQFLGGHHALERRRHRNRRQRPRGSHHRSEE